jgi:hypothetical protein
MRFVITAFMRPFVALAIVASLVAPSQARKSEQKNPEISGAAEADASSRCNASQMAPDGTWTQVPCREVGSGTPAPQRTSAGNDSETPR